MAKNMELAFRIASKLDASVVGNFKKTSDEMKKMQEEMKKMKAQEKALAANKSMEENMNKQHKAYLILNRQTNTYRQQRSISDEYTETCGFFQITKCA
mgnify:CR=1 FL=1